MTEFTKPSKKSDQGLKVATLYHRALTASQSAYAEHKYTEALQSLVCLGTCTTQGKDVEDQLQVLDLRCMILVKLKNFDSAIAAAKSMIRLNKQDARGFCRIASIEAIRGNWSTAVKFLEYGQNEVSTSDKLRSHLLLQLNRFQYQLLEEVRKGRHVDPMEALPLELLQMVLSYLEYAQVVIMLRVSKEWRKLLSRLQPLTTTIDFRAATRQISHFMLKAALDRIDCPKLIAVNRLSATAAETMNKRLDHWKKLTSLECLWTDTTMVPKRSLSPAYDKMKLRHIYFGKNTEVDIGTVYRILSKCPLAQQAYFLSVTNGTIPTVDYQSCLTTLDLCKSNGCPTLLIPAKSFGRFPNLQSLSVRGCSAASEDPTWDLSENHNLRILDTYSCMIWSTRLPRSLQRWAWGGHSMHSFVGPASIAPQTFPYLHNISLSGQITVPVLQYLRDSGVGQRQLTTMALHHGPSIDELDRTNRTLDLFRGVQDLSLACEDLIDDDTEAFNACFPNLRNLQLTAPRITGVFLADVLKRNGMISGLALINCRNVSPDTIRWVRARGVETRVHLASIDTYKGQRVRGD